MAASEQAFMDVQGPGWVNSGRTAEVGGKRKGYFRARSGGYQTSSFHGRLGMLGCSRLGASVSVVNAGIACDPGLVYWNVHGSVLGFDRERATCHSFGTGNAVGRPPCLAKCRDGSMPMVPPMPRAPPVIEGRLMPPSFVRRLPCRYGATSRASAQGGRRLFRGSPNRRRPRCRASRSAESRYGRRRSYGSGRY